MGDHGDVMDVRRRMPATYGLDFAFHWVPPRSRAFRCPDRLLQHDVFVRNRDRGNPDSGSASIRKERAIHDEKCHERRKMSRISRSWDRRRGLAGIADQEMRKHLPHGCRMTDTRLDEIVAFGEGLILRAGQILQEQGGKGTIRAKGAGDYVTEIDERIQAFLVREIERFTPEHRILAEEGMGGEGVDGCFWVIDPLDGTMNFIVGIPFQAISVAFLQEGEPLLGWVYDPIHGELFHARKGKGSFCNGAPIVPLARKRPPLCISSGFGGWLFSRGEGERLASICRKYGKIRNLGAQALQLAYVAAGRLLAVLNHEARIWDDAAGALIVQEAGGHYSNVWGAPIFPLRRGWGGSDQPLASLAAPPTVHREILEILAPLQQGEKG
ncbi:MAG: inositol monophosphatase [Deltaproteobacteria bacterium]|nr:MAG: inositol monophosphatase [Deltaproteobacteria bacterium]